MNTTWLQSRINDIYGLHKKTVEDYGELVQSLNQEADIFCEIIPGYKITSNMISTANGEQQQQQHNGEDDDGGKAKTNQKRQKEVYNVEKLESESLKQYAHFLDLIAKLQKKAHPEEQALGCRLCCKILPYAHAFNYNDRLLRLAVNFANAKATRVAQPALRALQELLNEQMVSETTQFVVDAILEIVRKVSHALNPKLLTLLLSIRVAMIDVHKQDIAEEKAKDKRMKKEDKELARQMRKGKARRDRAELAAKQTRILNKVFVIYLRVLQASRNCPRDHQAKILAPTLEGLVKFAPLVNQELFRDLSAALKELLNIQKKLPSSAAKSLEYNKKYGTIQLPSHSNFYDSQQGSDLHGSSSNRSNNGNGSPSQGGVTSECTVAVALHALVAAAALANKDETLDQADWKEDLIDYQEKLFQLLPEALAPPPIPKPAGKLSEDDDEQQQQQDNDDAKSSASSVVSTTSSLASTAFSIAQSMANHTTYVRGSVVREWTYRCNLVVRAFDALILTQRHLPVPRVAALVRRVANFAPLCPHHIGMSLLALCHRAVIRFPAAGAMFMGGADYEGGSGGITTGGIGGTAFRFDATELSTGNPDGHFTWELSLLRRSFQPAVRELAAAFTQHYNRVSQIKPGMPPPVSKQLDGVYPDEVLEKFDPSTGLIVPPPQIRRFTIVQATRRERDEE